MSLSLFVAFIVVAISFTGLGISVGIYLSGLGQEVQRQIDKRKKVGWK